MDLIAAGISRGEDKVEKKDLLSKLSKGRTYPQAYPECLAPS